MFQKWDYVLLPLKVSKPLIAIYYIHTTKQHICVQYLSWTEYTADMQQDGGGSYFVDNLSRYAV